MLHTLFGDLKEGRLARLPFLAYSILATVLAGFALLAIVLALGSVAGLFSGDTAAVEVFLRENMNEPGIFIILALGLALMFAHANLSAKRYRDMGLKGWKTLIWVSVLVTAASVLLDPFATGGLQFLVFLALALIPSGFFGAAAR